MPIIPPSSAAGYVTVNDVLNVVRVRLNDELVTLYPTAGGIIGSTQVFTQQASNNAWQRLQEYLAERGYARLVSECLISNLPVVASSDPASQTRLSWGGFYDGANSYSAPALPADFTHPLKIWERWSGQNAQFCDPPMEKILDGLPATQKTTANRWWEWREDAIYMPGSQMSMDLRIRYVKFLADFDDVGTTQWFEQPVPIMRCTDSLAWFMCAEYVGARGDEAVAALCITKAGQAADRLFNMDVAADQRVNTRRRSRSGRGSGRQWT